MSHQPERKERDCLNCGAFVQGRFCHVCGQENIITRETFWSLTRHFIFDLFHFDGKFFDTLKYILFRPGFVSKQYVQGRRNSYLNPINMYLFTSAFFFLIFFKIGDPKKFINADQSKMVLTKEDRMNLANDIRTELAKKPTDSVLLKQLSLVQDSTKALTPADLNLFSDQSFITFNGKKYNSLTEYDSVQTSLPDPERDGWFKRTIIHRGIKIYSEYKEAPRKGIAEFWEAFLHRLPYLLFVSLPFFALILKGLYAKRKNFYYSDHAVFTLHHYIFSFILLLFIFGFNWLNSVSHWRIFNDLSSVLVILWPVYLYLAMRNFYGQGKLKTFGKFLLLNGFGLIGIVTLFILFLLFSIFQL